MTKAQQLKLAHDIREVLTVLQYVNGESTAEQRKKRTNDAQRILRRVLAALE